MKLKIYTKTGDTGQTSLYGGKRVGKDDQRVIAYGTVDEVNSAVGVVIAQQTKGKNEESRLFLLKVQSDLFHIGATLAGNTHQSMETISERVMAMENLIDRMDQELPVLKHFILPSGDPAASFAHLARSICRRAEREVIRLQHTGEQVPADILRYLNRLSDFLFVLARFLNHQAGILDEIWTA